MRRKIRLVYVCCIAAAALCACLWFVCAHRAHVPSSQTLSALPHGTAAPVSTLFPDLNSMHVTALRISTPERSFQFHTDMQGAVSVNGQQADSEIFSTLLEQIAELPVEQRAAFDPQAQELLLTLVVSTDLNQQTARFYEGGSEGEITHILLGPEDAPQYRQTNGWRVGTLMMTCEGTRILDIHGNETPAGK